MNVAVINIKDILKILIKLIIVICLVIGITRLFNILKKEKNNNYEENTNEKTSIDKYSFLECLKSSLNIMEYKEQKNESINANTILASEIGNLKKAITEINVMQIEEAVEAKEDEETIVTEEENDNYKMADTDVVQVPIDAITEPVTEHNITGRYNSTYQNVKINNQTDIDLTEEILTPNANITNKKEILIYHTHTCESYTSSEKYPYEMTGNYRTTDLSFTVAKVGEEFAKMLTAKGFNVNHNKTCHDYPSYTGSYNNSLETVQNILQDDDTQIVFDIHRDAVGSSNEYAPSVKINGEYAAQIMFVIRNRWRRFRTS